MSSGTLRTRAAARRLGVSARKLRALYQAGEIAAGHLPGNNELRFSPDAIEALRRRMVGE